jgi:hypothetical protein
VPVWDDQYVGGRRRVEIAEGRDLLVLVEHLGRALASEDLTEDAIRLASLRSGHLRALSEDVTLYVAFS